MPVARAGTHLASPGRQEPGRQAGLPCLASGQRRDVACDIPRRGLPERRGERGEEGGGGPARQRQQRRWRRRGNVDGAALLAERTWARRASACGKYLSVCTTLLSEDIGPKNERKKERKKERKNQRTDSGRTTPPYMVCVCAPLQLRLLVGRNHLRERNNVGAATPHTFVESKFSAAFADP